LGPLLSASGALDVLDMDLESEHKDNPVEHMQGTA